MVDRSQAAACHDERGKFEPHDQINHQIGGIHRDEDPSRANAFGDEK